MKKPLETGKATPARRRSSTRSVTMADVAREAGVSTQTVSRAMRNPSEVSEETLQKVQDAIDRTNYVQNLTASHLASNRSMTVAAIIPTISTSIFAETISGLTDTLGEAGYQIFVGHSNYSAETEAALIRSFLGRRPDGFFLVGTSHTQNCIDLLKQSGVPVVESWDWSEKPIDMIVGFSNQKAMATLVHQMVDRDYKKLVFAGIDHPGDHRSSARLAGFRDAVKKLLPDQPMRLLTPSNLPFNLQSGETLLQLAVNTFPDCEAVLFSSDIYAAGAILAAKRMNINIPSDLAITGFGDYDLASHLTPSLTTVAIPNKRIGQEGARLLLSRMDDATVPSRAIDVGFEVMIRQSVARRDRE